MTNTVRQYKSSGMTVGEITHAMNSLKSSPTNNVGTLRRLTTMPDFTEFTSELIKAPDNMSDFTGVHTHADTCGTI